MPVMGFNGVIDISHHNNVTNWSSIKNAGIAAVIHKATEGRSYRDKQYPTRKNRALDQGLLWGSYHFSSGANPLLQVENYLEYTDPDPTELICLDYEPSSSGSNMTYEQMVAFAELVHSALGRYPVIYGGHLLREATEKVSGPSVLSKCSLWYARYAAKPIGVPHLWPTWTLWQYTDGNIGQEPHTVPGVGHCDRDTFNGSEAELRAKWPS